MKRTIAKTMAIILAFIMTASIFGISVFAASPTISVSGGSVTLNNEITVDVSLSSSSNAAGGNFTLQYDSAKLTPVSYTSGSLVSGYTNNCNLTYSSNSIRFTLNGANAITSSGKLVSIKFKAKATGSASLSFTSYKLYNTSGSSISTTASGNTITVNGNTSASLTVSGGTVNVNSEITTNISISSSSNAAGGNFTLQYDSAKLTPVSYTAGSLVSGYTNNCNLTYSSNSIRFTFSGSKAITSSGTLVSIKFKAKATGSAALSLKDYKLYNTSGSSITTTASGNTITVNQAPVSNYTVSYNANGGSVSPTSASVTAGNSVTLPTPTKNYTITYNANGGNGAPSSQNVPLICKGWSTSSSATSASYSCGSSYKPTSSITLYAVWNTSASTTISSTKPTRNNYEFLGWSTSKDGDVEVKSGQSATISNGNVVLYAVWKYIGSSSTSAKIMLCQRKIVLSTQWEALGIVAFDIDGQSGNYHINFSSQNTDVVGVYNKLYENEDTGAFYFTIAPRNSGKTTITIKLYNSDQSVLYDTAVVNIEVINTYYTDSIKLSYKEHHNFSWDDFNAMEYYTDNENVVEIDEYTGEGYCRSTGTTYVVAQDYYGNMRVTRVEVKYTFFDWIILILLFGWIWY